MTKELTFKDVYKLPLRLDEYSMSYIWSSNGVMTFTTLVNDESFIKEILGILNGDLTIKLNEIDVTYDGEYIKMDGHAILLLRGWGHLTGCGALNIPTEKAAKIQDDFANWVVNKLKGK